MPGVYREAQVIAYIQQYRERFKAIETQLALISGKLGVPDENPNDVEVPAEVRELAQAGKRVDAVKPYRILTGASLDVRTEPRLRPPRPATRSATRWPTSAVPSRGS